MMTKKRVFLISGIVSLILIIIGIFGNYKLCNNNESCVNILHPFFIYCLIFIPTFILSIITYKLKNEIFQTWLKFTYVWVPLTIILTFLAPEYSPSLLPITKGVVSFAMSVLFLLISLIIIITKSLSSKK